MNRIEQRTRELITKLGAPCNCGGPEYGTKHSPDCDLIRSHEDLKDRAKDEIYEEDEAAHVDEWQCLACGGWHGDDINVCPSVI